MLFSSNTQIIFETRRGKRECVGSAALIAIQANVIIHQKAANPQLFKSVRVPFG